VAEMKIVNDLLMRICK